MTNDRPDVLGQNETRMTAALPNLDIEIRHRDEGPAGEVVTLQMRAQPNMESAVRALLPALPFAMASANPLFMAHPLAASPFGAWMQLTRLCWQPFLLGLPAMKDNSES